MVAKISLIPGRVTFLVALCAAVVGLSPGSAEARVFVGIGIPFFGPAFYPPPVYYPPPAYYAPPAVYAPPPQVYTPQQSYTPEQAGAQSCYAGQYVCPMDRPVASGGSCYCPGNGGQKVWGRAN